MELTLELQAQNVAGLYGIAFDLTYPANLLRLEETTEGIWLSDSSLVQTSFLDDSSTSGRIVVGLTRLGDEPGKSGSGALLSLRFTAIGSGGGSLNFSRNEAFDADGKLLPSQSWAGGTVQVQL
jgi:hypothetical protein